MKKIIFLLIVGFLFSLNNNCQAQRLLRNLKNKIENKVEEKIEERIEEKADEEIDKKIDEAFEDNDSTSKETELSDEEKDNQRMQNIMGRLGVNSTPVEIEDEYSFSSNIKMEIESYKGNNLEERGHINSFFNNNSDAFAYEFTDDDNSEDKKGFFIYDQANNATIILSEDNGEKRGIVTGIDMDQMGAFATEQIENDVDVDADFSKANKTGRTKKILGYTCEEYNYKDEYSESTVWITKEKDLAMGGLFSSVYNNSAVFSGYNSGMILEAESKDLNTNEKSIMKITEINDNINKKIDLSDYEIVNMGSISIPQ